MSTALATFTADAGASAGQFRALVNWGDGHVTAGTVTGAGGTFTVSGTHTYAGSGSYRVTVTITSVEASSQAPLTTTDVIDVE